MAMSARRRFTGKATAQSHLRESQSKPLIDKRISDITIWRSFLQAPPILFDALPAIRKEPVMRLISFAACFAAMTAMPVLAQADPKDVLDARHGFMKMLAINMGTLAGMAKGEIAYDETAAATAGANIETLSHYTLPALFIPGTAEGEIDDSAALPAIWERPEQFAQAYAGLAEAAAGAGEAVKGGQGNIGPVLQKLGGGCKECHDSFRAKD
jgi:cytochrome c556